MLKDKDQGTAKVAALVSEDEGDAEEKVMTVFVPDGDDGLVSLHIGQVWISIHVDDLKDILNFVS